MERSLEDVETVREFAKLDRSDLKPVVQCMSFSQSLDNDAYRLLEVDNRILESLQAGDRLVVRGNKTDSAVLCTKDRTYELREAETSNSLLLLPHLRLPQDMPKGEVTMEHAQVSVVKHEYYELRPVRARLSRLKQLLHENMYSGPECEADDDHQGKKYTFSDLLELVQASEEELKHGIQALEAVEYSGYIRLLDFDFISQVLNHILSLIDEQSWGFDSVPLNQCCDILEDLFPREIVTFILKRYSSSEDRNSDSGEPFLKISEDAICRYFAEVVLRPVSQFNLEEFLQLWKLSVPEEMKPDLYQLEGVALVIRDFNPHVIKYFPVLDLPEDTNERFAHLFKAKSKWTFDEISPYIKDLATEKLSVSAVLTKNTRASNQNGIKVYSSKKPVK